MTRQRTFRLTYLAGFVVSVLLYTCFDVTAAPAQAPGTALNEKGKAAYEYWCATCHAPGLPGTTALSVKYKDGARPAVLAERSDLTPQLIRFVVRNGASIMPFFRKTEVSDADLEAMTAYLTRKGGSSK